MRLMCMVCMGGGVACVCCVYVCMGVCVCVGVGVCVRCVPSASISSTTT